jgi:biopolymer transport protein ExbB
MELNLVHLWQSMGLPSRLVAASLALMAILSLGVLFERFVYLARTGAASRRFAPVAHELSDRHDIEGLAQAAAKERTSPLARLIHAGAARYAEAIVDHDERGGLLPVEAAKRDMLRRAEVVSADLRRGLSLLATIGSLAPFVGLLGTVLGILNAFAKIGATGSGGLGAVSMGIAEALYETAFGLFVAIPSVAFFNYLSGRIDGIERDLTNATGEFVDELERGVAPITGEHARRAA